MKIFKRSIALFLTFVMIFSMMPLSAYAEDDPYIKEENESQGKIIQENNEDLPELEDEQNSGLGNALSSGPNPEPTPEPSLEPGNDEEPTTEANPEPNDDGTDNEPDTVSVTFHVDNAIWIVSCSVGDKVSAPGAATYTLEEGITIDGWYTNADCSLTPICTDYTQFFCFSAVHILCS